MSSKRGKRNSRSKKSSSSKQSEQLCMNVIDHGATISSSNAQNHFGYAPFELTISVDPHCNDLEPQPLNVGLFFEDGQPIDCVNKNKNSIRFHTKPSTLYLDQQGQCKFTVQIDTHSMFHENRAFKLVFNLAENATRHIRPCETKPFRLVKHRLEIMQEPDDTFYKDEGGRANCLRCRILLKDSGGNIVKNRDIPLVAKLVYEDMSVAQSSRDILEILTQNVELKKGQCQVDFRINEVSKNHNKRAFRVLYECKSQDALYHDISSCVTNKIMVKSKRTKKKGTTSGGRGRGRGRTKSEPKKRKRSIKQIQKSPITESSEDIEDLDDIDMDSDDNIHDNRPRKRLRKSHPHTIGHGGHNNHNSNNSMNPSINPYSHSFDPHRRSTLPPNVLNNLDINGDIMDNTQYVPPALTGILPSIRGGALPRIGHQPPPFASLSKKNNPLKSEKGIMGGGGVLGHMFNWCKLAGWVMNRLEWTHCGYEYDEATHSIDTTRPLYRCSYCLKYRNIAGWGTHENWCQLKLALKEYDTKVKTLHSEWNYQINNKGVDHEGGMTTMDAIDDGPPSNKDKDNNNNNTNNSDKDKNTSSSSNMALPSINNNGPTISTGFSVAVNNGLSVQTSNGLPSFIPNQSNGTLWGYATFQQQQGLGSINSIPNGLSSAGLGGFNHNHQSPLMNYTLPPVQPQLNTITANHTQPTLRNDDNNRNNNNNKQNINGVKPELLNGRNKNVNNNNSNDIHLPAALPKVASVARVRSQHGYDAFDKDNNFVGSFGDDGTFFEADQINDQYQPTFDSTQMMLTRNQSDDYLFYSNIRNSIGFDANSHK